MLTRREFAKRTALATFSLASLTAISGCNLPQEILEYAAVGKGAFDNVVALLEARGVLPVGGNHFTQNVDAAFDAVAAAVNAISNGQGGTLAKVAAALAAVTAAIQTFLSETNIPDAALIETVLALVQIILETIAGFASQLPNPPPLPGSVRLGRSGRSIVIVAKKRSLRQFKRDFNAMARSHAAPQVAVHESLWDKL